MNIHSTHCIENIFTVQDFWANCACLEKLSVPWNFSLYWIYFLHSGFLSNFCLPWKTECSVNLHWIYSFYHSEFWTPCPCPEKQSVPWIHGTKHIIFIIHNFEQLALALKNSVCPEFFTVLNILFAFRMFEQLALALKIRVCPEFFKPGGMPPVVGFSRFAPVL